MIQEQTRGSAFQIIPSSRPTVVIVSKSIAASPCHNRNIARFASLPQSSPSSSLSLSDDSSLLSSSPSIAEQILHDFHASKLSFRIIVIGNGAILESTSQLGPTFKSSISPKSGERLITFANRDASLEFHVKIEEIAKIVFVVSSSPVVDANNKDNNNNNTNNQQQQQVRRVARFINANGTPICSLLLAESTKEGETWFQSMMDTYGNEVVM